MCPSTCGLPLKSFVPVAAMYSFACLLVLSITSHGLSSSPLNTFSIVESAPCCPAYASCSSELPMFA
ncbi:hypothetical protein Sjap_007565 [Stephania japonica]|uniref:Uncharacterized protein n=1 Tax=Stephania japonica TaxID=461633 RepID=A0AAP0JMU6_9MAGN